MTVRWHQSARPSTTSSTSRSPFPRWWSIAAGTCFRPTGVRPRWSISWSARSSPGSEVNLADALVAPDVLRPFLANWPEVVSYFLRSVEADAAADGTAETAALLQRLKGYPGVQALISAGTPLAADGPVLPMHFQKNGIELRLFTTIATLGTPKDITLQELRIESFFPLDEPTREVFREWAASPTT